MFKLKETLQKRQTDPRYQTIAGIGAVVFLLLLVALVSELRLGPGEETGLGALLTSTFGQQGATPWSQDPELVSTALPNFILPLFWGGLLLTVLYAVVSPQYRKSLITAVLIVILITYALLRLQDAQSERTLESEPMPPQGGLLEFGAGNEVPPEPPAWTQDPPQWPAYVAGGLAAAGLAGGLLAGWQRYGRREEEAAAQIVSHAEEAIVALDAGENVASTIQRCYATMLQTFERQQRVHRSQGMTPREFEGQLQALGMHSLHVHDLSQLFERTRFGEKPATERDREVARDCLHRVVSDLGGSGEATP